MEISNNATVQMIQNIIDGTTPPAKATSADTANSATTAENAENAEQLGGVAASGYAKTTGTYSGMTVGNATDAVRLGGKGSEEYALKSEIVGGENLLINPDFRINQRGASHFFASDTNKTYTVDRWCLQYAGGASLDVSDDYIAVSGGILLQYIEDYKKLSNKTVTLSVQWKGLFNSGLRVAFVYWNNGTYTLLKSSNMQLPEGEATNLRTDNITFTIPDLSNSTAAAIRFYQENLSSNSPTYAIYWVKLEEGSVATPFISPDQGIELLKCQRFYQNIRLQGCGTSASTTTTMYPPVQVPIKMRELPTITVVTYPDVRGETKNIKATSISPHSLYDNFLQLKVLASGLIANNVYILANGEITADAEI